MNRNAENRRTMTPRRSWTWLVLAAFLGGSAACVQSDGKPTPFATPSTLALALALSASPDVLPLDGAAQSIIEIRATDPEGNPVRDLRLTLQIVTSIGFFDFGQLSAKQVTTGSNGRAVVTYTVPLTSTNPAGSVDGGTVINISATPEEGDFNATLPRTVQIRLVPPGTTIPAFNVAPDFTVTPGTLEVFDTALFDASLCVDAVDTGCTTDPFGLIAAYEWDFGDGTSATGQTATHAYSLAGTFVATLTVRDSFGRSASLSQIVQVGTGTPPSPVVSVSPAAPNVDDTVFFSATASTPGPGRTIISYGWDFGDGTTGTGENVSHIYTVADTYTVVLTATDDKGQQGTTTVSVVVSTSAPTALFTFSPTLPAVNETIHFNGTASTATSGRTLVDFKWVFGDGTDTSLGSRVTHSYSTSETFVARLTVTDSFGETGTTTNTVTVGGTGAGVTASFITSPEPVLVSAAVTLDASASRASPNASITNYQVDWGDSTALQNSTVPAPVTHVYSSAGSYTVTLTVIDSLGNMATDTGAVTVNDLTPPIAAFTATPTTGTGGSLLVSVDATASKAGTNGTIMNPSGYVWNWGDPSLDSTGRTQSHTYTTGTYQLRLTVTDDNPTTPSDVATTVITVTP